MKKFVIFYLISNIALAKTSYFQLNTKIGETIFKDLLIIDEANIQSGSLTVPGQFSTRIKSLVVKVEATTKILNFNFKTIENNQTLEGSYLIKLYDNKKLEGILNIDNQLFQIEGKEIYAE